MSQNKHCFEQKQYFYAIIFKSYLSNNTFSKHLKAVQIRI